MSTLHLHLHLDPVGGIAGDMFVAAILDAHPEFAPLALAAVRAAGLDEAVTLAHLPYTDGILSGSRFAVGTGGHGTHAAHAHVHFTDLRARLCASALAAPVRDRALAIFTLLAEAEARVHDQPVDTVSFHEVGAEDSIADIVAAATVIEALGGASWSIGAVPIGSGTVATRHGELPVPAPATVRLLEGFRCFDDGRPGERVTPTGAAIIRYLAPGYGLGTAVRSLRRTGYGFGTRRFDGISNILRVLEFETADTIGYHCEQIAEMAFEIDDQTPEDLALALAQLRARAGVLDVTQLPLIGKQGRLVSGVRLLAQADAVARITDEVFRETTTLGLRITVAERVSLPRREVVSRHGINVKVAERPGGASAKAELRDLAATRGHRAREDARTEAEIEALGGARDEH